MENTAKNFALQLGSLISLYVSIGSLISLLFGVITILHPDPAQYAWEAESAAMGIRTSIAMLVVFFPTYIILTRLVNTIRRTEKGGTYLTLTRWLIYISLLIGGGVLLGDLVTVLLGFLNGELTVRLVLKAITVFVVVGSAFIYYVLDARGYWQANEKKSIQYALIASLLVIVSLVVGFTHTETPSEVRERNIDVQQISDLQGIQSHIEMYYQMNNRLPEELEEAYNGLEVPTVSEGREEYDYLKTSETNFKLCAQFALPSSKSDAMQYAQPIIMEPSMIKNPYSWEHKAGDWCFERSFNASVPVVPVK